MNCPICAIELHMSERQGIELIIVRNVEEFGLTVEN